MVQPLVLLFSPFSFLFFSVLFFFPTSGKHYYHCKRRSTIPDPFQENFRKNPPFSRDLFPENFRKNLEALRVTESYVSPLGCVKQTKTKRRNKTTTGLHNPDRARYRLEWNWVFVLAQGIPCSPTPPFCHSACIELRSRYQNTWRRCAGHSA